ncbi:MAG: AmmeMemoRadiSam system radical SAM enzyme [Candidatus Margulisbacteria bacterium]|nr:AmmeMemoRadiSam system radical SAM enzyme [Candidatus Margulisiibacteriota bacterium]
MLAFGLQSIQNTSKVSDFKLFLKEIKQKNLSFIEAKYFKQLEDNNVQCQLCPNFCFIKPGERGKCGVRINKDGKLYTLVYARPVAIHVDPIEKKPFSHVLPGTKSFSIATPGCNLGCLFCQNWQISQALPEESSIVNFPPEKVIASAKKYKCKTIAFTYTEPTIFYEYMLDIAKLAKKEGIKCVMHSCGYINKEPLEELLPYLDAVNIDLKSFSPNFYRKMCSGQLQPVLDTLVTIKKKGVWLEITNLIIPGKNDDPQEIQEMCAWIKNNLGEDVPIYFSAFSPNYQLKDVPATPVGTLNLARDIAKREGLKYVYIGNIYGNAGESTYCPKCGEILIKRMGYNIIFNRLEKGKCNNCGAEIPGVWN